MRTRTLTGAVLATVVAITIPLLAVSSAQALPPGKFETQLVSVSSANSAVAGDDRSSSGKAGPPVISADGRYIAFSSYASNLTSIVPIHNTRQVYVRDIVTGVTEMVSSLSGVAGDADSSAPSISSDGTSVAYLSVATNLVGGTDGSPQVLIWSRATRSTRLVSVNNDTPPSRSNGGASAVSISADGSVVAFASGASNLTSEATGGWSQIYTRDLNLGRTSMVSVDSAATPSGAVSGGAESPVISGDGKSVAFVSMSKLTPIDPLNHMQVFLRDLTTSTTTMVSLNNAGAAADGNSDSLSISADGRLVAFHSAATDLMPSFHGSPDIYIRDIRSQTTTLESVQSDGVSSASGTAPALSPDGKKLAFASFSAGVVPGGVNSGFEQLYVRNRLTGTNTLTTGRLDGAGASGASVNGPSLSGDGAFIAFASPASDLVSTPTGGLNQVYVKNLTPNTHVDRVGGADRFEVAAAVSASSFAEGTRYAFIASGSVFPDALSGAWAAGVNNSPVLLTTKDAIPPSTATELARLKPRSIILLGGTATISTDVESALKAYAGIVLRLDGSDRYEVSAAVSRYASGGASPSTAYIASGEVFPDALSGSAAAGWRKGPVLLTGRSTLPDSVKEELKQLAPSKIVVLGGANSVSESVVADLSQIAPTTRIAGADRFAVSAGVSLSLFPANSRNVYIASGAVFPDALSAGAAAIVNGAPVLLVTKDGIPEPIAAELSRLKPTRIVVLGGTNTVSDEVVRLLNSYLAS